MEITPTTTRSTAAPLPERVASDASQVPVPEVTEPTGPSSNTMEAMAWFDLNGDGKIDNVSTFAGGDSYMSGAAIDLAQRVAVSARPQLHVHVPATHGHLFARAAQAYAAHAAAQHDVPTSTRVRTPVKVGA